MPWLSFLLLKALCTPLKIKTLHYHQTYPLRQSVMWPDKDLSFIRVKGDETATHYGIESDGNIRSVISLFMEGSRAQIRKLATEATYRNKRFASTLISHCVLEAAKQGCTLVWLNARILKKPFYERLGFKATQETFDKEGISYVIMELKLP